MPTQAMYCAQGLGDREGSHFSKTIRAQDRSAPVLSQPVHDNALTHATCHADRQGALINMNGHRCGILGVKGLVGGPQPLRPAEYLPDLYRCQASVAPMSHHACVM